MYGRPYHAPNLAPQEVPGRDSEQDEGAFQNHLARLDLATGVLAGFKVRECGHVMNTLEMAPSLFQCFGLYSSFDPPQEGFGEGTSAEADLVKIAALQGVVARMEGGTARCQRSNSDVGWKTLVEVLLEDMGTRCFRAPQVEVCHLAKGMYPSIRAS